MDRRVVGDARSDRVPGAAIDNVIVAQREDAAVVVEADLDVMQLVARMRRTHHVLAAIFDPAYRSSEPAGEERDQQILGIDVAFAAETAADIQRDTADARFRQAQQRGGFAAHPMNHLGRGPDRRRVAARIIGADDAAAFHRHGGIAMVIEAPRQPVRRACQCGVGVASANREIADQVGLELIVHDATVRTQRRLGVNDRGQLLEIRLHQFGRVFGLGRGSPRR